MLAVVGTVPDQDFALIAGKVILEDHTISIEGNQVPAALAQVLDEKAIMSGQRHV